MRNAVSPYTQLRERITGGHCPPGSMLVPAAVGVELGLSRTPVREALHRLESEGLVTKVTRGYVVRERSEEEVLEICDARIALESAVAHSAAGRRSDIDVARLSRLLESAVAAPDPASALRLHNEWHAALRVAAHNTTIAELMDRLDAQLAVYDAEESKAPSNLTQIEAEHREIHAAVVAGDGERARTLMIAHQERTRDIRIAAMASR
ncbi:GntR family transcriptional regulator [Rhodococcus sp. NPDC003322]